MLGLILQRQIFLSTTTSVVFVGASTSAMPLRETEAIVLRTYRLGEADKILSLFTRQFGRLRAAARGAQRPRSRYGGTLESLSYIRLWLFERENRDLLRLNSAELLESFFDMQREYRVQIAAQYVAEASERLLPERELNERVFRLLLAVLRGMKRSGEIERPLLFFNYWLLRLGGFLPDLTQCGGCGRGFGDETAYYHPSAPTLLGNECRLAQGDGNSQRAISTKSLGEVQSAAARPLDRWMESEYNNQNIKAIRELLEAMVEFQAERKLVTRGLLAEI
jgi:DNA repair protein RecO (recombination protein O)